MVYLKRLTLAATCTAIIYLINSKTAEKENGKVHSMELAPTFLYTLVFIVRRIWKRFVRLFTGTRAKDDVTPASWGFLDETIMRVLHFSAKLGDIHVPRMSIDFYSRLNRLVAKPIHGIYVTDVPSSLLGFGPFSAGEQKFGKEVSDVIEAVWVTLDGESFACGARDQDMLTIFYVHGGGFVIGNNSMYLAAFSQWLKILRRKGIRAGILSLEYPLAPKFKHPIPIEASWFVFDFLSRDKGLLSHDRTIIAGDSAGGSIALAISARATKFAAAACVLFSPWVGHSHDTDSHRDYAEVDFIGGRELLGRYQSEAVDGGRDKAIVDDMLHVVGPSRHFELLPRTWVSVGEVEVFMDDICEFARNNLQASEHEVYMGSGMPHIFPMLYPLFQDDTRKALESCATFCVSVVHCAREQSKSLQEKVIRLHHGG